MGFTIGIWGTRLKLADESAKNWLSLNIPSCPAKQRVKWLDLVHLTAY